MIAVVIPFYQREPGLLHKCLRSAFAQRDVGEKVQILIVDDESPVSAESELATLGATPKFPVRVLRQRNAGPGAARNTALDNLPLGTRYVAFLDSDDEWSVDHLAHALRALRAGHDMYFANFLHLGSTVSAFDRRKRLDLSEHPAIDAEGVLRSYTGDMFNQVLSGNVIMTSTVVFDAVKFNDVRFRPDLRFAGEDYLFWMALAKAGGRFAFSTDVELTCGRGVNVNAGSIWGTDGLAPRTRDEIRFKKIIGQLYPVTDQQRRQLKINIRDLRKVFALDCLHRVRHRKPLAWKVIRDQVGSDPLTLLAVFSALTKVVSRRIPAEDTARQAPGP
jgi:succinoglycan biosynthesis protein ExoW